MSKIIFPNSIVEEDTGLNHKISKVNLPDFSYISIKECREKKDISQSSLIVEKAKKDAEVIMKEAYKTGWEAGLKNAVENNKKEIAGLMLKLQAVCNAIENSQEKILNEMEPQILEMIIQIAKKIIKQELTVNKDKLSNILHLLLEKVKDKTEILVKVSSEDYEFLENNREFYLKDIGEIKNLFFEKKQELKTGDFIIESKTEIIDARIENQIDELRSVLGLT